ncbi:bactofilin family protein [Paenibacillus guangzhouensis]|uniref:hypothetical protein n=1 Tax=Paenibacillus guangzhouensis TaxID=1473112 RepID=UPI001266F34C|nr:hypothetical protein [Paenibacillus guangzhouensis]
MGNNPARDLRITGSSSAAGGYYRNVSITGDVQISGDIHCETFRCTGDTSVLGAFEAKITRITGTTSVNGDVTTDRLNLHGELKANRHITLNDAKIGGQLAVRQNLTGEDVKLYGMISVDGDCAIDHLRGKGAFEVQGLLNVGRLDLDLFWPSTAREIGGEQISVRKPQGMASMLKSLLDMFKTQPDSRLITDSIEGDDIHLENTTAKIVRGNRVTIGSGCIIERVEYRSSYQQAPDAAVEHCIQT